MNLFLRTVVQSLAHLLVATTAIVSVFYFGPTIETEFFPVVKANQLIAVPNKPNQTDAIRVLLYSVKQRENCQLVNRLVSVRIAENQWVRGTAYFKEEDSGQFVALGKTRPIGDVVVDEVTIKPYGIGLHVVLVHKCHPFWLTTTPEVYIETLQLMPAQSPKKNVPSSK